MRVAKKSGALIQTPRVRALVVQEKIYGNRHAGIVSDSFFGIAIGLHMRRVLDLSSHVVDGTLFG